MSVFVITERAWIPSGSAGGYRYGWGVCLAGISMDTSCLGAIIGTRGHTDNIVTRETVTKCQVNIAINTIIIASLVLQFCREQRITGFVVGVLLAVSVPLEPALAYLPLPVLYGVLLLVGLSSFSNIQVNPNSIILIHFIEFTPMYYVHNTKNPSYIRSEKIIYIVNFPPYQ